MVHRLTTVKILMTFTDFNLQKDPQQLESQVN